MNPSNFRIFIGRQFDPDCLPLDEDKGYPFTLEHPDLQGMTNAQRHTVMASGEYMQSDVSTLRSAAQSANLSNVQTVCDLEEEWIWVFGESQLSLEELDEAFKACSAELESDICYDFRVLDLHSGLCASYHDGDYESGSLFDDNFRSQSPFYDSDSMTSYVERNAQRAMSLL